MHKTQQQARDYAKTLANLHNTRFHVVKLPKAEPGSGRYTHGITGRFYGGVRDSELSEWLEDTGAELLDTVEPDSFANGRGLAPENDYSMWC